MLGECRLGQADDPFEFTHRLLAVEKLAEDHQTVLVAHRLE
ncbi:hypothetical protein MTBUT4_330031 [Magnetospirillum sp. UT-4]|nr:hypothetical protein MTBUT4_330031 [Magnetospirillum sp. UT-4]